VTVRQVETLNFLMLKWFSTINIIFKK